MAIRRSNCSRWPTAGCTKTSSDRHVAPASPHKRCAGNGYRAPLATRRHRISSSSLPTRASAAIALVRESVQALRALQRARSLPPVSKGVTVMSRTKLSRLLLFLICAVGVLASSAFAQTIDKKVYFTFSGPVEIPGATLPAGKYLFHLADPDSGRQVLQVQSADGKRVYGMFFSMAVQRPTAPDEAEVRFMETASGSPAVISTLWYAGERTGRELIYPRQQALRIAKSTNTPVLSTKTETKKAEDV